MNRTLTGVPRRLDYAVFLNADFMTEAIMLGRLRKLVFNIRHRTPAARFADSVRRVTRLARLMTAMQKKAPSKGRVREALLGSAVSGIPRRRPVYRKQRPDIGAAVAASLQVNFGSRSDSRTSSGQRPASIMTEWAQR
jgi:hypothetical protein